MPSVTVRDFATEVKIPVDALLTQLREAGVSVENEDSTLSDADKTALLQHIRSKRGGSASASTGSSGRIGLKRKTTTELKLGGGRGAPSRTVSVEVRKRRTFEKPPTETEQKADEREQARPVPGVHPARRVVGRAALSVRVHHRAITTARALLTACAITPGTSEPLRRRSQPKTSPDANRCGTLST